MERLNQTSALRIALVVLLGLAVLEFVWVETQPGRRGSLRGRFLGLRSGCPSPGGGEEHGTAAYAWRLQALDGSEVAFEQFRDKVVFINVWATWCGPCREEMPAIQALFDAVRSRGVEFVIVSEETLDVVKSWVQKQGYTFPVYVSTGGVPRVFDTPGIPATFVVNRAGQIVLKRVGARDWASSTCQEFLKALL